MCQYLQKRNSNLAVGNRQVRNIPGLPEVLYRLREIGLTLIVVSNKETAACRQSLEYLGLANLFSDIYGTTQATEGNAKATLIHKALEHLGLREDSQEQVLMVGDRKYDVESASLCGIESLGVDFCGFAPEGELLKAGAIAIVHTAEELLYFIQNGLRGGENGI